MFATAGEPKRAEFIAAKNIYCIFVLTTDFEFKSLRQLQLFYFTRIIGHTRRTLKLQGN